MNDNFINKELTHEEMQELLADYAFGKLSPNEATLFENNIDKYLDLKKELSEISSVFQRIESMDYNRFVQEQARNLSVKVNAKNRKVSYTPQKGIRKFLVPIIGLIVIAFYVGRSGVIDEFLSSFISKERTEIISSNDIHSLLSDINVWDIDEIENNSSIEDLALLIDKQNSLEEIERDLLNSNLENSSNSSDDLNIQELENIEKSIDKTTLIETELQKLIEELENAKFD